MIIIFAVYNNTNSSRSTFIGYSRRIEHNIGMSPFVEDINVGIGRPFVFLNTGEVNVVFREFKT